jgi:phosphatidylglycerol:prolipoprotein diacylglycerol transferase
MPDISFPNLGIEIQKLPQTAFKIFSIEIRYYAIVIVLGILAGLAACVRRAKKSGQNPDLYYDFLNIDLITAIIGARLYYVAFSFDLYKDDLWSIINIRNGGLAIYGSVIASVITAALYCAVKKIKIGLFFDTCAPSLILGQAIGRWGNFFNREAHGGPTDSLFAMRIATESGYIQVHPTFLYESLWCLAAFLILEFLYPKRNFDGQIAALYFLLYGLGRVWIEGMRTDQLLGPFGFPVSQALSAALIVGSIIFIAFKYWRNKRVSQPPR